MSARFQLVIDCKDPELLARFWAAALGYVLEPPPQGFATWDDWRRDIGLPDSELGIGADSIIDPCGDGTLALIQYCGLEEPRREQDQEAALAAIRKVAPDIAASWPAYRDLDATLAGMEQRRGNVSQVWAWSGSYDIAQDYAGRLFGDVQASVMPKLVEYTLDELGALLRTMSFYARLSPGQRQALEREQEAMYERFGRPIRASTVVVLVTARRSIQR